MNYLKQLFYDLRHQKMMTWVSISGTAVSVFLVMVLFMAENVKTVEIAPENNRKRIYTGMKIEIRSTDPNSSYMMMGDMSYGAAKILYGDLEGVELVSFASSQPAVKDVFRKGAVPLEVSMKNVDGNFWKIYDFNFLEGTGFSNDDCLGNSNKIVITRSMAHTLFSTQEAVGREVNIGGDVFVVSGVIEDVNPILQNAWAQIYQPLTAETWQSDGRNRRYSLMGWYQALLLYGEDTDPEAVKKEVQSRFATLNANLADEQCEVIYKGTPYSVEETYLAEEEDIPDLAKDHRKQWMLYIVLILLPAINLSSMMRGRIRHRISELGVRRAFGAKRIDIIAQLMGENLLVTIVGGAIGLILSYLFMMMLSSEFFMFVGDKWGLDLEVRMTMPTFGMLFTWGAFFVAVGACLILNLLTATVPAWRAALVNPAVAISKSRN